MTVTEEFDSGLTPAVRDFLARTRAFGAGMTWRVGAAGWQHALHWRCIPAFGAV